MESHTKRKEINSQNWVEVRQQNLEKLVPSCATDRRRSISYMGPASHDPPLVRVHMLMLFDDGWANLACDMFGAFTSRLLGDQIARLRFSISTGKKNIFGHGT